MPETERRKAAEEWFNKEHNYYPETRPYTNSELEQLNYNGDEVIEDLKDYSAIVYSSALLEAAELMCGTCNHPAYLPAENSKEFWIHKLKNGSGLLHCLAGPIHERRAQLREEFERDLENTCRAVCSSTKRSIAAAIRNLAEKEPLNNETKKRDAIAWMEDAERWLLNPTKPNISNAAISIKQAIVTLKSQPAAPRTQGREWKRQESYPECDGDGCNNCAPEDWAWAAAHELIFPDDECGDRYSDVDTKEAAKVIRKHFDLAQARTQPAPRTTLPDHYKFADEWVGKHYVHKYPTQVISDIPVMDAVQMLADFVQQFFTALPAATKEEK